MVGEQAQSFPILWRMVGLCNEKSRNHGPLTRKRSGSILNPPRA
jgi:hypothetical protein